MRSYIRLLRLLQLPGVVLILLYSGVYGQNKPSLIPWPQKVIMHEGHFALKTAVIRFPEEPAIARVAQFFGKAVEEERGLALPFVSGDKPGIIRFELDKSIRHREGYAIAVTPDQIRVAAASDTGLFHAVQTLLQLIVVTPEINIPCAEILDFPRYSWRSSMLDVGRHFFPAAFIKQHIDLLSFYKCNIFHWHLTEDQGWRIEIRKYPALTSTGAWRQEPDGTIYSGFYTQQEIREVVEYARERYITVVPEIELPGHCLAALASYPDLSCRKIPFQVAAYWGVINDVYCAGQEETYQFLEDVFDEVLELFPSPWIHIGGDEVPKYRWQNCPVCKEKIRSENLKDEQGLQSYFIRRIEKYLRDRNRTLIGWDEILEGGASAESIIEVWRGDEKAREALHNGNRIIQTLYLNRPPESINLRQSLAFNPAVPGDTTSVLGGDAPLWSENITEYNAHYMLWPRMQAFSEALWNGATSFDDFYNRLAWHKQWMDGRSIAYGGEDKNLLSLQQKYQPDDKKWKVTALAGPSDLALRYTLDGGIPSPDSRVFRDSLWVDHPAPITIVPYRKQRQAMEATRFNIIDHLGTGKEATFLQSFHPNYGAAGVWGLTDGITGSWNFGDGSWLGWWGNDLEVDIDLDTLTTIRSIRLACMQQVQSWIMLPRKVQFLVSADGENWKAVGEVTHQVPDDDLNPTIHAFTFTFTDPVKTRYIRVKAVNYGTLPSWHNGAGGHAWIFADEVVIK